MTAAVRIDEVSLTFRGADRPAIDRVSLRVEQGELLALLGPSGAGKTTLLRLIAGFERPHQGTIHLGDREVAGPEVMVPVERRGVGFVFQHGALFPHLTVRKNIGFGLSHLGAAARAERIARMAELAAIEPLLDRYEHELSGGERQRAALARALARGNDLILLDEPLSNVDRPLRMGIGTELRTILTRAGATAVMVTHDQEEALGLADRVALMDRGRMIQVDRPEALLAGPVSAFVADFLSPRGSPGRPSPTGRHLDRQGLPPVV